MKDSRSNKRPVPFEFVVEELASLRPTIKNVFGFTYVYLDQKLLLALRNNTKRTGTNGMWLFTTSDHIDSLMKEFPDLSRRQVWRSGKNCWVVLAARLECFEEYAFKACELILNGDPRIGRLSRRYRTRVRDDIRFARGVWSTTFRLRLRNIIGSFLSLLSAGFFRTRQAEACTLVLYTPVG